MSAPQASFLSRLWVYQSERFPLAKTVPLLAVFSAASITISAVLAGRDLPAFQGYLIGFGLVFVLFFQMRVCDEVKDLEDDRAYRPERPIPRGLIQLREVVGLGLATVPVAIALALIWGNGLIWLLLLVWLWLVAMTFEFGAPLWLKTRPVLYLLSHMAIMPLIDLMLTGVEWGAHGSPHAGLWLFIGLSFSNGCVLEIGRKIWAPENERYGVDSYSSLWGRELAVRVWLAFVATSFVLLLGVGWFVGAFWPLAVLGVVGLALCTQAGRSHIAQGSDATEKRVDKLAGLWVFLCYASAGFLPLLFGGAP